MARCSAHKLLLIDVSLGPHHAAFPLGGGGFVFLKDFGYMSMRAQPTCGKRSPVAIHVSNAASVSSLLGIIAW